MADLELEHGARPLDQFSIIRSHDPENVQDTLVSTYGAERFSLERTSPDFNANINRWQSKVIGLSYCDCSASVEVDFPAARFFRQQFSIRGTGISRMNRTEYPISSGETCIVQPGCELTMKINPNFEQVILRIDAEGLKSKLAAFLGVNPGRNLVFEPSVRLDTHSARSLKRAVTYFVNEVSSGELGKSPVALAELEQSLITAFLFCNRSNYSSYLDSPQYAPANHQLRRMEEYIHAHWNEPLTVEEIAHATSLSARSIFHHFRRSRGQSPMSYVKQIRLEQARQMLMRNDADVSVTGVAFACGFGNLGHFASDYFRRFGERPSETIRIARCDGKMGC